VDTIVRLLEQALAHIGDRTFVLTDLLWDTHKHSEFGRQVDVLSLLLDFEEWLCHLHDLLIVLLLEVSRHGDSRASITLLEVASLRAHVKSHIAHLVSLVVTVASHDNGSPELVLHGLLVLLSARLVLRVAHFLLSEAIHLLVD
jgi:hypothetical protein